MPESEMGEIFASMHKQSKAKKKRNKQQSTDLLISKGIQFESKNNGVHLIVQGRDSIIDFWPSTGKYIVREPAAAVGRGIMSVINLCEIKE